MAQATGAVVECHAQRLLNPFRGVVQVIRYAAAEAVSTDGLHWDIYVSNSALLTGLEHNQGRQVQISDIRYGSWSAAKGLKRGPLYPSEDFRQMEAMGAVVYEHLLRVHDQVPFPLGDDLELWLLDVDGAPLALLDSAVGDAERGVDAGGRGPRWHAGYTAEAGFASAALVALGEGGNAAACLTRHINARAGPRPAAQWFRRQADGTGQGGAGLNLSPDLTGRRLPADRFPAWLLADAQGHDPHQALLDDYRDWLAPFLLQLWGLDTPTRARLEQQARRQAEQVCRLHRLYPQVVDPTLITAARVESMLCGSAASRPAVEEQLPTYYIELSPGGPE
jgi:hypothetical protein